MANDNGEKTIILDTTLRDGAQQVDINYTPEDKIQIANLLAKVGVDIIEVGYPAATKGEFNTVHSIAKNFADKPDVTICGLASTVLEHIDDTGRCLAPAASKRIHTYIGTSPKHIKALGKTEDEVIADAVSAVKRAKMYTDDVQFSAEDAIRTDFSFLKRIFEATIEAGATTINVPDTVGIELPEEIQNLCKKLRTEVKGGDKVIWSMHCHEDLGNATANTVAAVKSGIRQVECTINGYGERGGNTNLKEVVMNLDIHGDKMGVYVDINRKHLIPMERLMSSTTGIPLSTNRAGGENANAHKSGGHQSKVSKDRGTYEILDIRKYGGRRKGFVIDIQSGRAGVQAVAGMLGFSLNREQREAAYTVAMDVSDATNKNIPKKTMYDIFFQEAGTWKLKDIFFNNAGGEYHAKVKMVHEDGHEIVKEAQGNGSINAAITAIKEATEVDVQFDTYETRSLGSGDNATARTVITAEFEGNSYKGSGFDTSVDDSAAKAFVGIVNQVELARTVQTREAKVS